MLLLLTGFSVFAVCVQDAYANGTVYIRADGSVEPSDAPIDRNGDLYTLTGNISTNADGIRIERDNMVLDGAGYAVHGTGGFMGIALYDRSNVTIKNVEVTTFLWGVYVSTSSNINLIGNNIVNNTGGIMLVWASTDNSIVGNNITDNTRMGVHLFGQSGSNTITGNRFVNDGLVVSDSYGNVVETNVANGRPLVYLEGVSDFAVADAGQVVLVSCDNVEVEGLNLAKVSVGLELLSTNNSRIANNNVTSNGWHGIHVSHSMNNAIAGNKIEGNNEYGVSLSDSWNNTIAGNSMAENKAYGIRLEFSSNNTILGNDLTDNGYGGIGVESSSSNNSVSENIFLANHNVGVKLGYSSRNNVLVKNNITNNGVGVAFDESSESMLEENTFIGDGLWSKNSYGNSVEGNTINGKPLVYLENRSDYTVSDAGQVLLVNCNNIRVENLDLSNAVNGLQLFGTSNSIAANNTILEDGIASSNRFGIWFSYSANNSLVGNNIGRKWFGIYLDNSSNNTIAGNTIAENAEGILADMASNYNRISENIVTDNGCGIDLTDSQFCNIFDNSVSGNGKGISVRFSSENEVYRNEISVNSETGIFIQGSNNYVHENSITDNEGPGIWIFESNWNAIVRNNLANNTHGISLSFTTPARPVTPEYNTISENNITANRNAGISLENSSYGRIYHNNFVDNAKQALVEDSPSNVWADGYPSGGNYWSDYAGADLDKNGIGDTAYAVDTNGQDSYPLMGMHSSYEVSHVEQGLILDLISNCTVSNFEVLVSVEHPERRMIWFNVTGESDGGFVRICIPHALMNESYHVTVNGQEPHFANYTIYDNGTHRWIYFDYFTSTQQVIIVPEFQSILVVLMLSIATSLAVILNKKRLRLTRASV